MKPEAKQRSRLLLAVLPALLGKAVAEESDICELAGLAQGTSTSGLNIDLAQVRELVSSLGFDQTVQVAAEGGTFPLRRTRDGVLIGRLGEPEPTQLLLEAGLLDADAVVRRRSLDSIASGIWPAMQAEVRWRQLVEERPLSPSEVMAVIETRKYSPRRFIEAFDAKTEFAIEELVPDTIGYFDALVGAPPADREYGVADLLDHLNIAVRGDAFWGWRLVRAAFVGNFFSPAQACAPIDNNLLQDFLTRDRYLTPASVLAALEVRLHGAVWADVPASSPSPRDLWEMLSRPEVAAAGQVAIAIFRLTFTHLAFMDSLRPANWRRTAALVHANLVADVLGDLPDLAQSIHVRCSSLGALNMAAEAWDIKEEPVWQAGLAILANPVAVAAARGKDLLVQAAAADLAVPADLLPEEPQSVHEALVGLRVGASPLEMGESSDPLGAQVLGVDDLGLRQFQATWSPENWNVLLAYARMGPFSREVLDAIEAQLSSVTDSALLCSAARIAVAQTSETLAGALRSACASAMSSASQVNDVALIFQAATVVAALQSEHWSEFMDGLLRDFATGVRPGKPAQTLLFLMEALLRLVPMEKRQWRAALALARCAA